MHNEKYTTQIYQMWQILKKSKKKKEKEKQMTYVCTFLQCKWQEFIKGMYII